MKQKLSLRGRQFVGNIVSAKAQKTVVVEWTRLCFVPKYERYEKKKTKLKVHVPDEMKVNLGDKVRIVETRPISKTKNFIVVEILQ